MEGPKLTDEQVQTAYNAIRRLEVIFTVLDNLQECGEDCQLRREAAKKAMAELQTIIKHFAPGTP